MFILLERANKSNNIFEGVPTLKHEFITAKKLFSLLFPKKGIQIVKPSSNNNNYQVKQIFLNNLPPLTFIFSQRHPQRVFSVKQEGEKENF